MDILPEAYFDTALSRCPSARLVVPAEAAHRLSQFPPDLQAVILQALLIEASMILNPTVRVYYDKAHDVFVYDRPSQDEY